MPTPFLISYLFLWAFVVLQAIVMLAMLRQIGLLHLRINPRMARVMAAGPQIGELVPPVTLQDVNDLSKRLRISHAMERAVLLLFVSPRCPACVSIMPAIKPLVRESNGDLAWALVAAGDQEQCDEFRQRYRLDFVLFAYAPDVREEYKVSVTPYALLISKRGIVLAKGLINQIEHLESLFSARIADTGGATADDHVTVHIREGPLESNSWNDGRVQS